jgi:dihydroorotase
LLPLTLRWAEESRIALPDALARVTSVPARLLGIEAGRVVPGAAADLCIFDPEVRWTVAPSSLRSQGKNSPFGGLEMKGKVLNTLVDGHIVHEAGR